MNLTNQTIKLKWNWLLALTIALCIGNPVYSQCPEAENVIVTEVTPTELTIEWEVDPSVPVYAVDVAKNGIPQIAQAAPQYSGSSAFYTYTSSVAFEDDDIVEFTVHSICGNFSSGTTETYHFTGIATVEDIYEGEMPDAYTGNCEKADYYVFNNRDTYGWNKLKVKECWYADYNDDNHTDDSEILKCLFEIGYTNVFYKGVERPCSGHHVAASGEERRITSDILDVILSPNPLIDVGQVEFTLLKETKVSIDITDISGSSLYHEVTEEALNAGQHQFMINRNHLQPGMYFIRIHSSQSTELVKFSIAY